MIVCSPEDAMHLQVERRAQLVARLAAGEYPDSSICTSVSTPALSATTLRAFRSRGPRRARALRWLFFPDATVRVGSDVVVRDGKFQF